MHAAHLHFRRQGGARLRHGQAHHQAHQRRRRRDQRRPRRAATASRWSFFPDFNVIDRPAHLSRRRSVRADFHRRQGSLGHRQHEVRHERRADHRHPGRRQCRNPRRGGARRISSCSGSPPRKCRTRRPRADPRSYYHDNLQLREALDLISSGFFSHGDTGLFAPLVESP